MKINKLAMLAIMSTLMLTGCAKPTTSTTTSQETSSEEVITYTPEEAVTAVATTLGTKVTDYSDDQGPYFVTGAAWAATSATLEDLKSFVPTIMPVGFELVQDWEADTFTDGTPFEGSYYLCGETVLANAVYADNYSGTDVVVLQVSSYLI